jgi:drug/metabolite transporter (DMT)-like permease
VTATRRAEWLLISMTFLWSGTFVVVKGGLRDISPFLLVALRFTLAALCLLPFALRSIGRMDRTVVWKGFLLGFLIYLGFIFQTAGLQYTTASKSAFITGMLVIFTPFFQYLLLKRPPRRANLAGIVLVSIGLWFLTEPAGEGINRGDFLTLLCALAFGLSIVLIDRFTKEHDPFQLTFLEIASPALFAWIALPFFERPLFSPTPAVFFTLGYTAILATVLTTYVQTRYQRDTTPTRAALIFTLEPVWTAILGFVLLDERLGLKGLLGGGLIIAGILFSELAGTVAEQWEQRGRPADSGDRK